MNNCPINLINNPLVFLKTKAVNSQYTQCEPTQPMFLSYGKFFNCTDFKVVNDWLNTKLHKVIK